MQEALGWGTGADLENYCPSVLHGRSRDDAGREPLTECHLCARLGAGRVTALILATL